MRFQVKQIRMVEDTFSVEADSAMDAACLVANGKVPHALTEHCENEDKVYPGMITVEGHDVELDTKLFCQGIVRNERKTG